MSDKYTAILRDDDWTPLKLQSEPPAPPLILTRDHDLPCGKCDAYAVSRIDDGGTWVRYACGACGVVAEVKREWESTSRVAESHAVTRGLGSPRAVRVL